MASSPVPSLSPHTQAVDVFERLLQCERLLTAREVAQLLSVSPKTIYAYVGRNMIPHYKIGTSVRFSPKDVSEWIRKRAA